MMKHLFLISGALLCATPLALPAQGECTLETTALVLSGGGAKGLAHVGVIKELDRLGIRPDLVVGTSMGAVVGALYASGLSGIEIEALADVLPLRTLFSAVEPRGPVSWGSRLPLLLWEEGDTGFELQGAAADVAAINAMLNTTLLRANLIASGDFSRLPIPLKVVATDLSNRAVVVLGGGDLAQAVRASIAIPLVMRAQRIGEQQLVDGGLSANVPVAVARDAGATRVLVSDLGDPKPDSIPGGAPFEVASKLLEWLFKQPADSLGGADLLIRPRVSSYSTLDFTPTRLAELVSIGSETARQALSSWPCPPLGEPVRDAITPRLIASVISDSSDAEAAGLVRKSLGLETGVVFDVERLAEEITELTLRGQFRELWLNPTVGSHGVDFTPRVRNLPQKTAAIGIAYDAELGGRLWAGALHRRVPVFNGEASLLLGLSRYHNDANFELRRQTLFGQPSVTPVFGLFGSDRDLRRFDSRGIELPSTSARALYISVGFEGRMSAAARFRFDGFFRSWEAKDPFTDIVQSSSVEGVRGTIELMQSNRRPYASISGSITPEYARASLELENTGQIGRATLTHRVRVGVGRDLSADNAFFLGGDDGFPGLKAMERPGDNEVFTSLTLGQPIAGAVKLLITGAYGRTAYGATEVSPLILIDGGGGQLPPGYFIDGQLLKSGGWLVGGRVGLGADTPIGPVRVEFGVNDLGRSNGVLRVGRWH